MIIVEIGLNHLGSVDDAKKIFLALVKTDVDAITFQVREDKFYINPQFSKMKLPLVVYETCLKIAKDNDKKFGITLSNTGLIKYFDKLSVDFYKILSKDLEDISFLKTFANKTKKDVYLSTGLASISSISSAIDVFKRKNVKLIHTSLSHDPSDANLRAIQVMKDNFKNEIAYGHHSSDRTLLYAAQAFCPSDTFFYVKPSDSKKYPDCKHAIKLSSVNNYIFHINNIKTALGTGLKIKSKNKIEGQS